jgi:hypothetical protein
MSVELYQLHSMHSIVSLYSTRNNRSANVVNQIFLGTEYARQNWIEKTNESAMHADGSHGHNPICVVTMSTGIWQLFFFFFRQQLELMCAHQNSRKSSSPQQR